MNSTTYVLIWVACWLIVHQASGEGSSVLHQAQLQQRMRLQEFAAVGCTKLLHSTGEVGCAAEETDAPLLQLKAPDQGVQQETVVFLAEKHLDPFLVQLQQNTSLQSLIKGILVNPRDSSQAESPAPHFPQAVFSPYQSSFVWNPPGASLDGVAFPFPIIMLNNDTAIQLQAKADYNQQKGFAGALHHAKVASVMSATANSSYCIQQQTCQPLGGHSIWAAAPPLAEPQNDGHDNMSLVMVLAPVDSTAFFKAKTVGAASAVGSLITLMALADILANNTAAVATYSKRLILTALTGEAWGYMGSKRLLWEVHTNTTSTVGLDLDKIRQVVEIGQVGQAGSSINATSFSFYSHTQHGPRFGNASQMQQALQEAAASSQALQAEVYPADSSNPGIPPASLSSFLRTKPSIEGMVFTDHSATFKNCFYQSHLDTPEQLQAGSLVAAAMLLAQALHTLAAGPSTPTLQVDLVRVQNTVSALLDCLLTDSPGLQCPLGQSLLGADNAAKVEHYVGVLRTLTKDSQDPSPTVKSNIERFIWNFLALRLSQGKAQGQGPGCDPYSNKCQAGAACVEHVPGQSLGQCVNATVSYVPAFSTHLACQDCDVESISQWQQSNTSVAWERRHGWPPDPMWTESNWPLGQPSLDIYQKESAAVNTGALLTGLSVVAVSIAALVLPQVAFRHYHQ